MAGQQCIRAINKQTHHDHYCKNNGNPYKNIIVIAVRKELHRLDIW